MRECPLAFVPVGNRPLAYVDVETSGLQPDTHEILSIAIVFDSEVAKARDLKGLTFSKGEDYAYFSTLVQPQQIEVAEPKALEVNGYAANPEKWLGAPSFNEIATQVAYLLDGAVPVGHNVTFDTSFIQDALRRAGNKTRLPHHTFDTVVLALEHLVPCGVDSVSLDNICPVLGVSNEGNHNALPDALRCRSVYKQLVRATWWDRFLWRRHVQRSRHLRPVL